MFAVGPCLLCPCQSTPKINHHLLQLPPSHQSDLRFDGGKMSQDMSSHCFLHHLLDSLVCLDSLGPFNLCLDNWQFGQYDHEL